jgi:catechol 2,3-dioxygenase-like lactoylglutathione lyase family enzyme
MALGKIDHMDFTIGDLEKAEEYFTKKLGFKFLRRIEHQDKSISSELTSPAGDFILQLHQGSEEELKKRRERAPEWSLYFNHIAFKVDDINKEFKELKSKGVSFKGTAPMLNPVTGRTLANAADADGRYWIQLTS